MAELPSISSYGNYESDNYGVNTLRVSYNSITIYYSYKTIIAYRDFTDGLVICENVWSVTTGKHLNWINPDHSIRLSYDDFQEKLQQALNRNSPE